MLPDLQKVANRYFNCNSDWFDQAEYNELVRVTGHDESKGRKFLLTHDSDPRHSFKQPTVENGVRRASGQRMDRRLLPASAKDSIPLHPVKDYVPSAPKVQDCIQSPIEMVLSQVKQEFRELFRLYTSMRGPVYTPENMFSLVKLAFFSKVTPRLCAACWEHGCKAIRVWKTPSNSTLVVNGKTVFGTGGNQVPRRFKG